MQLVYFANPSAAGTSPVQAKEKQLPQSISESQDRSTSSRELAKEIETEKIKDESLQQRADISLEEQQKRLEQGKFDVDTPHDIRTLSIHEPIDTPQKREIFGRFQMAITTLISKAIKWGVQIDQAMNLDILLAKISSFESKFNFSEREAIKKLKEIKENSEAVLSKIVLSEWHNFLPQAKGIYERAKKLQEQPESWMKSHPVIVSGMVVAGAYGLYKIFKLIFGDNESKSGAESKEGGGIFGFIKKAFLALGSLFTLGSILSTDKISGWMKEKLGFDLKIESISAFLDALKKGQIVDAFKALFGGVLEQDPNKALHEQAAQEINQATGKKIEAGFLAQIGSQKYKEFMDPTYTGKLVDSFLGWLQKLTTDKVPTFVPIIGSRKHIREQTEILKEYFAKHKKQKIQAFLNQKKISETTTIDQVLEFILESGGTISEAGSSESAEATAPQESETVKESKEEPKDSQEKFPETEKVIERLKEDPLNPGLYFELAKAAIADGGQLIIKEGAIGIFRGGMWLIVSTESWIINTALEVFKGNEWYSKVLGLALLVEGPLFGVGVSVGLIKGAFKGLPGAISLNPFKILFNIPATAIKEARKTGIEAAKLPFILGRRIKEWRNTNMLNRFAFDTRKQKADTLLEELEKYAQERGYVFKPGANNRVLLEKYPRRTFFKQANIPEMLRDRMCDEFKALQTLGNRTIDSAVRDGLVDANLLSKEEFRLYNLTDIQKNYTLIERKAADLKKGDQRGGKTILSDEKYRETAIKELKSQKVISESFRDAEKISRMVGQKDIQRLSAKEQIDYLVDLSLDSDAYLEEAVERIKGMKAAGRSEAEIAAFHKEVVSKLDNVREQYKGIFEKIEANAGNLDKETKKALNKLIRDDLSKATGVRALWREIKGRGKYALIFGTANIIYEAYRIKSEDKEKMIETKTAALINEVGLSTLQLIVDIMAPFGVSDWYTVFSGKQMLTQKEVSGWDRYSRIVFGSYSLFSDTIATLTTPAAGAGIGVYAASNVGEALVRAAKEGPDFVRTFKATAPQILEIAQNAGGIKKLMEILKDGNRIKRILEVGKKTSQTGTHLVMAHDVGRALVSGYQIVFNTKGQKEIEVPMPAMVDNDNVQAPLAA